MKTYKDFINESIEKSNIFDFLLIGNVNGVKRELNDINKQDNDGSTPLILASVLGYFDIVKLLVENNANVNIQNNNGNTALIIACMFDHFEIAKLLIENNADFNLQNNDNQTAFDIAHQRKYTEICKLIATKILETQPYRAYELQKYLTDEQKLKYKEFIATGDFDLFETKFYNDYNELLLNSAKDGDLNGVKKALLNDANINIQDNDGYTALMLASHYGHTEIVKYLIDNDANLDIQNKYGNTALIYASNRGHTQIAKYLIDNKANLDIQDYIGNTALISASCYDHTEIAKYLIDNKANLDIQNKYGNTALIFANANGNTEIVKYLIDNDANMDIQNKYGNTALRLASANGHIEICKLIATKILETQPYRAYELQKYLTDEQKLKYKEFIATGDFDLFETKFYNDSKDIFVLRDASPDGLQWIVDNYPKYNFEQYLSRIIFSFNKKNDINLDNFEISSIGKICRILMYHTNLPKNYENDLKNHIDEHLYKMFDLKSRYREFPYGNRGSMMCELIIDIIPNKFFELQKDFELFESIKIKDEAIQYLNSIKPAEPEYIFDTWFKYDKNDNTINGKVYRIFEKYFNFYKIFFNGRGARVLDRKDETYEMYFYLSKRYFPDISEEDIIKISKPLAKFLKNYLCNFFDIEFSGYSDGKLSFIFKMKKHIVIAQKDFDMFFD